MKVGGTSDEMVTLMKTGQYDAVSASGDATLRLIYGGDVAPVNTDLVPNYATVSDFLKDRPWNSVERADVRHPARLGRQRADVPHRQGHPGPDSWGVVFEPTRPYKGKITAYDSPIYIADAALYLMKTKPDLEDRQPVRAGRQPVRRGGRPAQGADGAGRRVLVGLRQGGQSLKSGDTVLGTEWQINVNLVTAARRRRSRPRCRRRDPPAGRTPGWSRPRPSTRTARTSGWTGSSRPKVNAQVAEWFGEAPAQTKACDQTADKSHCTTYHAAGQGVLQTDLATGRRRPGVPVTAAATTCKDYAAWTRPGPRSRADRRCRPSGVAAARRDSGRCGVSFLHRAPGVAAGRAAGRADALAGRRVPRLARGAVHRRRSGRPTRFTGDAGQAVQLDNFQTLLRQPVYRTVALRTIGVAAR